MAASQAEKLRAAALACLLGAPQIPDVGSQVTRAREDKYSDREANSINIKADSVGKRLFGSAAYDCELTISLEIYVRAAQDEVWETKADAILVAAHARLKAYNAWPAGFAQIQNIDEQFGGDPEDHTPGMLTAKYAIRYLSSSAALDAAPNQP